MQAGPGCTPRVLPIKFYYARIVLYGFFVSAGEKEDRPFCYGNNEAGQVTISRIRRGVGRCKWHYFLSAARVR